MLQHRRRATALLSRRKHLHAVYGRADAPNPGWPKFSNELHRHSIRHSSELPSTRGRAPQRVLSLTALRLDWRQAAATCTAGTSSSSDCAIWEQGGGLIKPMCIGDVAAGSTCVPTYSRACAEPGISQASCDAHEGCHWSSDRCVTTTSFNTCMAEVGNGQTACEDAGAAPGHCTYRLVESSAAGNACMSAYLNGDEWDGNLAGSCPTQALDRPTGL